MAMQFPQSETTAGDTVSLGTTDSVFVASSVYLASTGSNTIYGAGSNHRAIIDGTVASDSFHTVHLGDSLAVDSGQSVEISASGEIRHFGVFYGIVTFGADSAVNNDGLVTSAGDGIFMGGDAATLTNSGTVLAAGSFAVFFSANASTSVLNNSGLIEGATFAFAGSPGNDEIINTGRMTGDITFSDGDDIYLGANGRHEGTIFGGSGNDTITGGADKDDIEGGSDNDILLGGNGNDKLKGDAGNDKLLGGRGRDSLTGGDGNDRFVFAKREGKDTIQDFENGNDKLDLKKFKFGSKSEALSHFFEIGSGSNDKVGFKHQGTTIVIKGIDMGDVNGGDILV